MMLFDSLSSMTSSTSPIFLPAASWMSVPITLVARIADVWPEAVGMGILQQMSVESARTRDYGAASSGPAGWNPDALWDGPSGIVRRDAKRLACSHEPRIRQGIGRRRRRGARRAQGQP